MMTLAELDLFVFSEAKNFLIEKLDEQDLPSGMSSAEVLSQQCITPNAERPNDLKLILKGLVGSAANANSKPGVLIKSVDGGFEAYAKVLFDFSPEKIASEYTSWEDLFSEIKKTLKPRGKLRTTSRSLWPQFCKSILAIAEFINQFENAKAFYKWADIYYLNEETLPALPLVVSKEVKKGIGFALACDFLKELGFVKYGKPDVILNRIFVRLGLCDFDDDYWVFKSIIRLASNCKVLPYEADKTFWLVGSGDFYNTRIFTGKNSEEFISQTLEKLQ